MSIVISRDATPSLTALPRTLILASAGSGKTFRISSGIIGLLARGHAADEIFASTFTRKAAGEILERVLLRLAAAALDSKEAAELAAHAELIDAPDTALADAAGYTPLFWANLLEQLARSLHRVNIGTLDAFFLRTAASFGQELGFPTRWSIADDTMSAHIRSLALQDVLATTDDGVLIELVRGIMRRPGTRSIHEQLLRQVKLLAGFHYALEPGRDDHWTGFDAGANGATIDFRAERDALADRIQALPVPQTKAGTPNKVWRNALSKVAARLRIGDWAEFTDEGLVRAARSGETFSRLPVDDSIRASIDAGWELGRAEVARDFAARSHALRRFAELYTAALDRRRRDLGAYEFDDITRSLGGGDPLGARPDMYFRLDARARHILLDEFQDTSAPQWEALAPLADELMAGHEHERSAVIVADPKQSIYGWRGGAPDLVERLRRDYSLSDDALTKSWRSSHVVLDFVNDLYARVGEDDVWGEERYVDVARDWLRAFEPHSPAKDLAGYVRVEVGPADEDGGEARPRLCRFAAERVAELHARMPGFTIGVLTRTNATVARMMMNLKQLGVHASEEGGNPLTDAAPVSSLLALLRMVDHPGHTVARYHVAKTPVGNAFDYTDHHDTAGARRLASRIRRQLVADGYGATMARLADRIVHACDAREERRLRQLVELAFRYEPRATLRTADFIRYVQIERVEDPVAADVRVMTVHQAKGLEFDIVVLPELDADLTGGRTHELLAFRPEPGSRIRRAFPYVKKSLLKLLEGTAELDEAAGQWFAGELRDGLSTVYVALTRAKHALHVIVKPDKGSAKTGAGMIRRALADGREAVEGDVLIERGNPQWHHSETRTSAAHPSVVRTAIRIPMRGETVRTRTLVRRSPSELEGGVKVDVGLLLRLSGSTATRRGSIAHSWLEQIAWLDEGVPDDARLRVLARDVDPDVTPDEVEALLSSFGGWLATASIAEVLSRPAGTAEVSVEREVPFMLRDGDSLMEGFIDRLVLYRDAGQVIRAEVVDFKTDAVSVGDTDTLQQRIEHYSPQLNAYRRAISSMYGLRAERVVAKLVFVEPGAVIDLVNT